MLKQGYRSVSYNHSPDEYLVLCISNDVFIYICGCTAKVVGKHYAEWLLAGMTV